MDSKVTLSEEEKEYLNSLTDEESKTLEIAADFCPKLSNRPDR